jgi:hypothetical protein
MQDTTTAAFSPWQDLIPLEPPDQSVIPPHIV